MTPLRARHRNERDQDAAGDQDMTTTKTRKTEPSSPPTLDSVARKKLRTRLEEYRSLLTQQVAGEELTEADLTRVADCLEALGLPDFAWTRDCEAVQRHAAVKAKFRAAVEAEGPSRDRSLELAKEIDSMRARLAALLEQQRKAQAGIGKPAAYGNTLAQLEAEHPHAIGDIDTAVTLRLAELNRRKGDVS